MPNLDLAMAKRLDTSVELPLRVAPKAAAGAGAAAKAEQ
jgi:hypothetical protein